ncbi:MAG: DUF3750 domain-containing protein [Microcystis sp.]
MPLIGSFAVYHWYGIFRDQQQATRWEIWQTPNLAPESWGHLHKNLMLVESGVGNGGSWIEKSWEGDCALKLIEILEQCPQAYPYCYCYRYFPVPNSNTYRQWVLNQAGIDYRLGFKGIGKNYERWVKSLFRTKKAIALPKLNKMRPPSKSLLPKRDCPSSFHPKTAIAYR